MPYFKWFKHLFLLLITLYFPQFCHASKKTNLYQPPDIILITIENIGIKDLTCYGGEKACTPNIGHLAQQGIIMTDYYASSPTTPLNHYALLTGLYHHRLLDLNENNSNVKYVFPTQEPTIATMLKQAGYTTAFMGKWPFDASQSNTSNHLGFDVFISINDNDKSNASIITQAIDFIQKNQTTPFFLHLACPLSLLNQNAKNDRSSYNQVEQLDREMAKIESVLNKHETVKNTLIILCSNTGSHTSNHMNTLRHENHLGEDIIRVPCIIRWPQFIEGGRRCSQTSIAMDLSATILAAAHYKPARHVDGFNLMKILNGAKDEVEQTLVWRENQHQTKAIRWGKWKWLAKEGNDYLYNLQNDPKEKTNLIERNSDILHWLKRIYSQWEHSMRQSSSLFEQ